MSEPKQSFDIATHHLWNKTKKVGAGVYISDMVRIRGKLSMIEVGSGVRLYDFAVLYAEAPLLIGDRAQMLFGAVVLGYAPIQICANAVIGPHASVMAGRHIEGNEFERGLIEIGTGAVVGAGAVILPGSIVPAGFHIRPREVYGAQDCKEARTLPR